MPDIVAHIFAGHRVLTMLGTEVLLTVDQDIFYVGQFGPDPFIFYRFCFPFARKGINHRSAIMHTERTGDFLLALARRCQDCETFSLLAGFLCHYALDSTVHPYIHSLSQEKAYLHMAIEHQLDMRVLKQLGKTLKQIKVCSARHLPKTTVNMAMKEIYGWVDDAYWNSYKYMKAFFCIVKDPCGILNWILKRMPERFSALSYKTELCKNMDFAWYDQLEAQAIQEAGKMINAAYRYWQGEIGIDELQHVFGDRPYA